MNGRRLDLSYRDDKTLHPKNTAYDDLGRCHT
jgi:hypothetical protein